jgi:hypothetical protein
MVRVHARHARFDLGPAADARQIEQRRFHFSFGPP